MSMDEDLDGDEVVENDHNADEGPAQSVAGVVASVVGLRKMRSVGRSAEYASRQLGHSIDSPNGDELATVAGPFWSSQRAQQAVGASTSEALEQRRSDGLLLGVTTADGATVYPVWQFVRSTKGVEVRPALIDFFGALRKHDGWAVAVLSQCPAPELDGLTPLEWVRAGRSRDAVRELAEVVDREWSLGGVQPG